MSYSGDQWKNILNIFALIINDVKISTNPRLTRIRTSLLIVFISLFFTLPSGTFAAGNTKTIVVFFSLHARLPAYQNLLEGFRTTFSEAYDQPTIY